MVVNKGINMCDDSPGLGKALRSIQIHSTSLSSTMRALNQKVQRFLFDARKHLSNSTPLRTLASKMCPTYWPRMAAKMHTFVRCISPDSIVEGDALPLEEEETKSEKVVWTHHRMLRMHMGHNPLRCHYRLTRVEFTPCNVNLTSSSLLAGVWSSSHRTLQPTQAFKAATFKDSSGFIAFAKAHSRSGSVQLRTVVQLFCRRETLSLYIEETRSAFPPQLLMYQEPFGSWTHSNPEFV